MNRLETICARLGCRKPSAIDGSWGRVSRGISAVSEHGRRVGFPPCDRTIILCIHGRRAPRQRLAI